MVHLGNLWKTSNMGMTLFDEVMQSDEYDLFQIQLKLIDDLALVYARQIQITYPERANTDELFEQQVKEARGDIWRAMYEKGRLII